ncbi:MAG: hypothetical protein JJE25_05130, partial [Bacteroidia bacterium]|nr:hypothetical protein [Bacteroidia bacterium]
MYFKKIIFIAAIVLCAINLSAQKSFSRKTDADYQKYPYWIEMMNDTSSNYFEAEKAFTLFWKNRIEPVEEKDIFEANNQKQEDRKSLLEKLFKSREEKQREESEKYAFQYKKFRHWQMMTEHYVQSDGRILYPSERLELRKQWQAQV